MRIGDTVRITEGPLVGLQARFEGAAGQRVLLVLELRGRKFNVEMDRHWIVATTPERRSVFGAETRGTHWRRNPRA